MQATAKDFATELSSALRDVTLPQPNRLLRFAKHVKTNSVLRNALGIADAQGRIGDN